MKKLTVASKNYPVWVCHDCAYKAQDQKQFIFNRMTFHHGRCDICGEEKGVTQPRDYGYPNFDVEGI